MFEDLRGRVALVTGGARGLGFQIASALAAHGCPIGLLDILDQAETSAAQLADEHRVPAASARCDVTDADSIATAMASVTDELGTPAILVNAAGITIHTDSLDVTPAEFRKVHQYLTFCTFNPAQWAFAEVL